MYHILSQKLFWATVFFALGPWRGFGSPSGSREWENEFVTLGYSLAHAFNLTSCWVCGGPFGLESWPWTSTPLSPEWLVSNYSEVDNDTYWEESAPPPWPVRYPAQGKYCLNLAQEGGAFMGISKCNWTYTYGNHCASFSDCSHTRTGWAWVDNSGKEKLFETFWSPTDKSGPVNTSANYGQATNTKIYCQWKNETRAWSCQIKDK